MTFRNLFPEPSQVETNFRWQHLFLTIYSNGLSKP